MWLKKLGLVSVVALLSACEPSTIETDALVYEQARAVKAFELTDQHGDALGVDDLKGQWDLVFLGYTSCPDICPMTLAKLRQVEQKLQRDDVNVWFVSVDPKRDTAQKRLEYINYFNPDYVAASGPHKHLYPFVQNLGLIYAISDNSEGDYLVDHSASVALIDKNAHIRAIFKPEFKSGSVPTINTNSMVKDLNAILQHYR